MLITRVLHVMRLLLLPQRYVFSSKSQPVLDMYLIPRRLLLLPQRYVFSSKSQLASLLSLFPLRCCCYHKGTYFQANHNDLAAWYSSRQVVVATTKVRIFKQITTDWNTNSNYDRLLLLPQRYVFSSKSQLYCVIYNDWVCCCCYHKGTYFQANHNY